MAKITSDDWVPVPHGTILTSDQLDPMVNFKTNADGTVTATKSNRLYWLSEKGVRKNSGQQTVIPYRYYTETYVKGAKIEEFYARRNGLKPETRKRIKLKRGQYGYHYEITCKTKTELESTLKELNDIYINLVYKISMRSKYWGVFDEHYPESPPIYVLLKTKRPQWIKYANNSITGSPTNIIDYSEDIEQLKNWVEEYVMITDENNYDKEEYHNHMTKIPQFVPFGRIQGYVITTEMELFPPNADWSQKILTGRIIRPMVEYINEP